MNVRKVQITTVTLTQFAPTWPDLILVSAMPGYTGPGHRCEGESLHRVSDVSFKRGIALLNRPSIEHS